jgi:DNA-binding transcriptional ArsR family regulator
MLSYKQLRDSEIMIQASNPTGTQIPLIFELHANFCRSLSNPIRLIILATLAKGEKSVGELANASGVTLANISQHLTVLRSHDVVKSRKVGQTVYYSIVDTRLVDACNLIRAVLLDGMKRQGVIANGFDERTKTLKNILEGKT